jgi:hypothetical protein
MRLMTYFVLAGAAACALAAPAGAQTFGGASSSDLLGYRSSAGHYYRRSLGSKVRSNAARRQGQQQQRPAAGKPGRQSTQTRPASSPRAAAGATTFRPVAPMLVPRLLAERAPAEREKAERFFAGLLEEYREIMRGKGLPPNDVARAASFLVAISHDVYGGGGKLGPGQLDGLREQMREVFAEDAEFQRLSDREKQELFEGYAIVGMYLSGVPASRGDDREWLAQMRRLARTQLEETFGVSVDRLVFTNEGVKYR